MSGLAGGAYPQGKRCGDIILHESGLCCLRRLSPSAFLPAVMPENIDGLSEAILEKFIAMGFIHNFGDIFEIGKYKDQIVEMEGFGQKSLII